mgnify:CR=1 FL=1
MLWLFFSISIAININTAIVKRKQTCRRKKKDIYDRRDSISFINPLHQNMKEKSVVTNINKKKGNEHGIDIHNGDIEMTLPTKTKKSGSDKL